MKEPAAASPEHSPAAVPLSVEFGHIYADETCGPEQLDTARRAGMHITPAAEAVVLLDDYNVAAPFDLDALVRDLEQAGCRPDAVVLESALVEPALELLEDVTRHRIQSRHRRYIAKHEKVTCSLLTAAWYLTRLGILDADLHCAATGRRIGQAWRLLNVLPSAYKAVEEEVAEILHHTPHAAALDRIDYDWTHPHGGESWERFKPAAYLHHNYTDLHIADRDITGRLATAWEQIGPVGRAVEVGCGPNLYPVLAALPYVRSLELTDYSQQNCDYLEAQLEDLDDRWWTFWGLLRTLSDGHMGLEDPRERLRERATVRPRSVYELPEGRWQVASMHFCAESITAERTEFDAACQRFCESVEPGGHLLASFMLGSDGYTVAGVRYPALPITLDDIGDMAAQCSDVLELVEVEQGPELVRDGYSGMAFLHAIR